ncbi:MAG: (d)CMP kinase [Bacilli bacterium]|nr:(d)CMP kinase [Bacilli bacterium]
MKSVIAIDGPAGSGKGTIAKLVGKKLGYMYIDSGAIYRCVALLTIRNGIDINDEEKLCDIAKKMNVEFIDNKVFLDLEDVGVDIRSKEVSDIVSLVSKHKKLRDIIIEIERNYAKDKDIIMEGRDITTVVFPNAKYKFYLDADLNVRAKRRYEELIKRNIKITLEEVVDGISKRDYNDTHKEVGALIRTDEQIYINTTDVEIEEVVNKIIEVVRSE